jgi:predicted nucleic acid-binding protein
MFILDTNVVSELRKGKPRPAEAVVQWAKTQQASRLFLTSITIFELERGVLQLERKLPPQGSALRLWLEGIKLRFGNRVLPYSFETAIICAALHVPDPRSERDAMIAATALQHGFTVVTRNTNDFKATGVPLLNPWEFHSAPLAQV